MVHFLIGVNVSAYNLERIQDMPQNLGRFREVV